MWPGFSRLEQIYREMAANGVPVIPFLTIISRTNLILGILSITLGIIYFALSSNILLYDLFGYIFFISWLPYSLSAFAEAHGLARG